ncbi:thioesterase II family protein [Nonomuraea sp. NPDC048826]|uniref:thioesterase II family protein n=1 Tax=Nonomuraea sp. NPDC048826 TaxID=3364347 RepID=UPI0037146F7F
MAAAPTRTGEWIRRFHPAPDAARLVCLPHAGGSATFFFAMSRDLSPAVEVLAVQYPGRQDRRSEPCVDDIRVLADHVADELRPWLDRPIALFGHSMGAAVAFEVAMRLERIGVTPVMLFASGSRAPSCGRRERIHLRDDTGLLKELASLSGTSAQVLDDEEIMRTVLPVLRNDYRAIETYRYRPVPPLRSPVMAITGEDDPQVTLEEAQSWSRHTTGGFALRTFPGGHFYLTSHGAEVRGLITRHLGGGAETD